MAVENILNKHVQYGSMSKEWTIMRDCTASSRVIKDSGITYLPRLAEMDDDQYAAYKLRASFPMFTKHTLETFVGMTMRKEVMVTNVPADFLSNVNGAGSSLTRYAKALLRTHLTFGRSATLVEYANGSNRAKLLLYKAEDILDWNTRIIDDVEQLSYVKLKESHEESTDMFNTSTEVRYRVLSLDKETNIYRTQVFKGDGTLVPGSEKVPKKGRKPLKQIPIWIHGGIPCGYPPLLAIAEQNLAWYTLDADYRHGLHYTALVTPWVNGVNPDDPGAPKSIGPTKLWFLPEGSQAGMLEFTGAGLGQIAKAKEEIHENIVILSSRILSPPRNMNETATAAAIRNAGETASLAEIVNSLSVDLTDAVEFALKWSNGRRKKVATAIINNDFVPTILSGADVASYISGYLKGGMSFFTLFHILKKGEIQMGDRNIEDEIKDIADEQEKRMIRELVLAKELAKLEPKKEDKSDPDYMEQGKDGEQVNKGQNFKEN